MLRIFAQTMKDAVFPAFCFGCRKEETYLCDNCLGDIDMQGSLACPLCHQPNVDGACCEKCRKKSTLTRQIAVASFDSTLLLGQMIHAWKYCYAEEMTEYFFKVISVFIKDNSHLFRGIDAITPVPLHPRRYAERGFNQAEVLANIVGSILHVPVLTLLERIRYTSQQALLSREQRKDNVRGAFALAQPLSPYVQQALVVDDVYTTGSTTQECARTLGIKCVGFTLARG